MSRRESRPGPPIGRALVFGASGQLGGAVAQELTAAGWEVAVATRNGRRPPDPIWTSGAEIIDATDRTRAEVLRGLARPVDAVFDPTAYDDEDARDLISGRDRLGAVVVVSSSSVYTDVCGRSLDEAGENGFPRFPGPIPESTSTVEPGPSTYSTRKVAMEAALLDSGVPTTILRPCAVYGTGATHPREWWFIKRALDGRKRIPVAYGAESLFHTSSARGIASLATLCMAAPASRVLNVADGAAMPVRDIANAIEDATRLGLALAAFDGPPVGPSRVGGTPWSAERPFVLDTSKAQALGWAPPDYRLHVGEVCQWVLRVAREADWKAQFSRFARYGYDAFDYAEEDRFLTSP